MERARAGIQRASMEPVAQHRLWLWAAYVGLVRGTFFILKWAVLIVLVGATYAFLWGVGYELGLCLHR
jgi:hypothetical protein